MPRHPDIKTVLPEPILDAFTIKLDSKNRDQYGLRWRKADCRKPFGVVLSSIGTKLGAITAGVKNVEKRMWPAITESILDPLIAAIAHLRGQHPNPYERIDETRMYFEAVLRGLPGQLSPHLRRQQKIVTAKHIAVGVVDPQTKLVRPEHQRSFTLVTALVIRQMQDEYRRHAVSAHFASALPELWYGATVHLGMPLAPVDNDHFLQVHRTIIEHSREEMSVNYPDVLATVDAASRRVASNTRKVICDRMGLSHKEFGERFDPLERKVLAV